MASQQLVLAGGNNITLSQSMDALSISATMSILGGNSYSLGVTSLGNISGVTGLVSQQVVLVGGNNVTLSESINAGSATVTISMGAAGGVTFSAGMSDIGNTSGDTGVVSDRLVFAGGDNVTLSQSIDANSATMTISIADAVIPTLSCWHNMIDDGSLIGPHFNFVNIIPLDPKNNVFPGNMTVNTLYFAVSAFLDILDSIANSGTLKLGIYTRNASSLSILNSASSTWGFAANGNNTRSEDGKRWITFDASLWSASLTFSQTEYYLGYCFHTSAASPSFFSLNLSIPSYTYLISTNANTRSGTFGVSITSGNTSMGWVPFVGESVSSIAFTAVLPASIQLSQLIKGNSQYGIIPNIVFNNISSNF